MAFLRGLKPSKDTASAGLLILHTTFDGDFMIHEFSDNAKAMAGYFDLEKEHPDDNIVLVDADTFAAIRLAYQNYFSDVVEFVHLIDNGCGALEKEE